MSGQAWALFGPDGVFGRDTSNAADSSKTGVAQKSNKNPGTTRSHFDASLSGETTLDGSLHNSIANLDDDSVRHGNLTLWRR